ncbi:MAG: bifunctional phosphoribosyl-AMP cyclohydrolase/phosphoribosyl-ATP diphosphatase HisIE [Shewanella sp.]|nr:bifunctional phosphoribosyl-AMP cyclohydrolase/phosphoribosyl-ATP diphosphatase HisIE [Shewanella sp.]MCF1430816.1 bifunctional phosphoribosyl-AMP cyclohydrolase/phosphoribosyl-ATP diphosphatase HisIE [Shewanella sp.]MCF1439042.1 bifunctional phosphoribosyl-AMP cyclohydrolase/phosphoribosyl-ATP diphosphatase HisIE [Shewanella sp.]MCF1458042.1 bifunctional phosphoribosyl-AMP cyclohydrolase/phosphoribosyl-ATP diphosphatase HisIE [Shewanella sp.]
MTRAVLHSPDLLQQANFAKGNGLLPAIIQHADTGDVLMQGWMNAEALQATLEQALVTFYSRSKQRLWTKGESSGHVLDCLSVSLDCDNDSLLVMAQPQGPTCHTGCQTCWHDDYARPFLSRLNAVIKQRNALWQSGADSSSYTASLFASGSKRIAQKVGEEGVESALAGATGDKAELINEAADLLFHLMVLLEDQGLSLEDVQHRLAQRHSDSNSNDSN